MSFRPDYLGGGFSATFSSLTVTGNLTVNGDFDFGSVSVQGLFIGDGDTLKFGNTAASPDGSLGWNTTQTVDGMYLGLATGQNTLIIAEQGDIAFDFAHGAQTNPTQFIHSAAQSTTQWGSLAHNQTDFVIASGAGNISLRPVSGSGVAMVTGTKNDGLIILQAETTTASNVPTNILTIAAEDNSVYIVRAHIMATGASISNRAVYIRESAFVRSGGTVTLLGNTAPITGESTASMNATIAASGTNIVVNVIGILDTVMTWTCNVQYSNLSV